MICSWSPPISDLYAAIDELMDKMDRMVVRHKDQQIPGRPHSRHLPRRPLRRPDPCLILARRHRPCGGYSNRPVAVFVADRYTFRVSTGVHNRPHFH